MGTISVRQNTFHRPMVLMDIFLGINKVIPSLVSKLSKVFYLLLLVKMITNTIETRSDTKIDLISIIDGITTDKIEETISMITEETISMIDEMIDEMTADEMRMTADEMMADGMTVGVMIMMIDAMLTDEMTVHLITMINGKMLIDRALEIDHDNLSKEIDHDNLNKIDHDDLSKIINYFHQIHDLIFHQINDLMNYFHHLILDLDREIALIKMSKGLNPNKISTEGIGIIYKTRIVYYNYRRLDEVQVRLINVREPKIFKYNRKFEKIPFFPVRGKRCHCEGVVSLFVFCLVCMSHWRLSGNH